MPKLLRFLLGALASLILLAICLEMGSRLIHKRLFGVAFTKEYVGTAVDSGASPGGVEEAFDPIGATVFAAESILHPNMEFVSDLRSLSFVGKPDFSPMRSWQRRAAYCGHPKSKRSSTIPVWILPR